MKNDFESSNKFLTPFFNGKPACFNHIHREKNLCNFNLDNELGVARNDCLNF